MSWVPTAWVYQKYSVYINCVGCLSFNKDINRKYLKLGTQKQSSQIGPSPGLRSQQLFFAGLHDGRLNEISLGRLDCFKAVRSLDFSTSASGFQTHPCCQDPGRLNRARNAPAWEVQPASQSDWAGAQSEWGSVDLDFMENLKHGKFGKLFFFNLLH